MISLRIQRISDCTFSTFSLVKRNKMNHKMDMSFLATKKFKFALRNGHTNLTS